MDHNKERFAILIQEIYEAKKPSAILDAFKNVISGIPSLNERDELKFTIFHHFCVISDKLEKNPEIIKEILSLMLKHNTKVSETMELFFDPIPNEEKKLQLKVSDVVIKLVDDKRFMGKDWTSLFGHKKAFQSN